MYTCWSTRFSVAGRFWQSDKSARGSRAGNASPYFGFVYSEPVVYASMLAGWKLCPTCGHRIKENSTLEVSLRSGPRISALGPRPPATGPRLSSLCYCSTSTGSLRPYSPRRRPHCFDVISIRKTDIGLLTLTLFLDSIVLCVFF